MHAKTFSTEELLQQGQLDLDIIVAIWFLIIVGKNTVLHATFSLSLVTQ